MGSQGETVLALNESPFTDGVMPAVVIAMADSSHEFLHSVAARALDRLRQSTCSQRQQNLRVVIGQGICSWEFHDLFTTSRVS